MAADVSIHSPWKSHRCELSVSEVAWPSMEDARAHFLAQWPIFSLLERDFFLGLRLACVFGSAGHEAIVVTQEGDVFGLGSNGHSCLGVGDSKSSLLPRRVELLCKKGVKDLSFGSGPHVIALTESGEIYCWGHNGYGQLGQGVALTSSQGAHPMKVEGSLRGVHISAVACGGHHTLALSTEGEVYAWGFNNAGQIGSGNVTNQNTPRKVGNALSGVQCSSIACTQASSLAMTRSGDLFAWGSNGNGQLGIGSNTNQTTPTRVPLHGMVLRKVVCGYAHVLALTDNGRLVGWGSNIYGQVGNGGKTNILSPSLVGEELGRFAEIAACHNSHISAAALFNGRVYMWGVCRGQNVATPLETKFRSVDEVFPWFSAPPTMWRTTILGDSKKGSGLLKCIAERFDDINTSDLTVLVEGRKIHVHKAILRMRSEYFYAMFQQGRWNEANKDSIEVCHFTYSVYYTFLKYLYTDQVGGALDTDDLTGLLDLADSYCEAELKNICCRLIWQRVTVDNVATLVAIATKYKVEDLEEQCLAFALNHMTEVVQSSAFDELESGVAKVFIQKAAQRGAFKT